jgi:2-methylcitrate dehydratase PrpD
MLAQYSVPFCVALAAFRDPADPGSFSEDVIADPAVTALARRIVLSPGRPKGWGVGLELELFDGRRFTGERDGFLGCPERPLDAAGLAEKYRRLTAGADPVRMADLLGRLVTIETAADCAAL